MQSTLSDQEIVWKERRDVTRDPIALKRTAVATGRQPARAGQPALRTGPECLAAADIARRDRRVSPMDVFWSAWPEEVGTHLHGSDRRGEPARDAIHRAICGICVDHASNVGEPTHELQEHPIYACRAPEPSQTQSRAKIRPVGTK
jgi:hypothetical protein